MYYVNTKDGSAIDWTPSFAHYPEGEWRKVTKKEYDAAVMAKARADLRAQLKPGATVYTVLRSVSRSGMMRHISLVIGAGDGKVEDITWLVARALGRTMDRDSGGIKEGGGGMDMGFHLVYSLGRALYPEGFAPSRMAARPSDGKVVSVEIGRGMMRSARIPFALDREWIEEKRAAGFKFKGGRNGDTSGWDGDGGYALEHRWL